MTKYKLKKSIVGETWVWQAYKEVKFLCFKWWEPMAGTMTFSKQDCKNQLVKAKKHWEDFNAQEYEEEFFEI